MINLVKILSTDFDSVKRRVVKFLRFGLIDVQTADEYGPHGIDSNPVKDMIAVYAETSQKGDTVIIGYLKRDQIAQVGETRLFSTDQNGVLKTYLWLKNDGTILLGGDQNNLTRFQQLEEGFNKLKEDHNKLVQAFNSHMHATAAIGPPSVPTAVPDVIPATPSTADISGAKIDEIKTI